MKATTKLLLLTALLALTWACSKTSDNNPDPNNSPDKVEQVNGTWYVSYYFDSGKDETHNYNGYSFTFELNGTLSSSSGSGSFSGTWRIGDHSSDDDNSSNRFIISIAGNKQMDDLADDWVIISITDNEISLKDDNPESMEELKFSRKNQ